GDVVVAGFADPNPAAQGRVADIPVFTTHQELYDRGDLDAVIVATPDFGHREPVVHAAACGLDMLIEKPLATTVADGEAMAEAITAAGVGAIVGFENRWNPAFVRIREQLTAADGVGAPVWQHAELSNSTFVPLEMLSWAAESSPAWFLMPHTVDVVSWMAESPVASVYATGSRGLLAARGVDTWDAVQAVLRFRNGSSASLTSSWVLPDSAPAIVRFTYDLNGQTGALRADIIDSNLHVTTDKARTVGLLSGRLGGKLIGAPAWMVNDFVTAVQTQTFDGPGLTQG